MTYSSGKRKGQIFSPYLINNAKTFIVGTLNKQHFSNTEMQRKITLLKRENRKLQEAKKTTNYCVRSLSKEEVKGKKAKARYIEKIRSTQKKKRKRIAETVQKRPQNENKRNYKKATPKVA